MGSASDAIIVGGGPAGASAAYFLRAAGLRALVLERESVPRDKPCGGAVPRSALRLLPFDFSTLIEDEISAVHYTWRDRDHLFDVPHDAVVMVHRKQFDAFLLSQSGAEVVDRTSAVSVQERNGGFVIEAEDGRSWQARYVLLAEGSTGRLSRQLGLRHGKAGVPTLEAEVPLAQAPGDWSGRSWFEFGLLQGGYLWVFPKRDHLSVGIVAFRHTGQPLRQILEAYMRDMGIDASGIEIRGHPLPVFRKGRLLHLGNLLLLGDAAGLVDPVLGEGVRYAMHSGKLAAETITRGELGEAYARRVEAALYPSLARAGQIAAWFYRMQRFGYDLITYNQDGVYWLSHALLETSDYVDLSHHLPGLAARYLLSRLRIRRASTTEQRRAR